MKAFPVKYDLKNVKLIDLATQRELLTFDARTITNKTKSAGFVGAGISSGGQRFAIATQTEFEFQPYAQQVVIGKQKWIITLVELQPRMALGRAYAKTQYEYVLNLE